MGIQLEGIQPLIEVKEGAAAEGAVTLQEVLRTMRHPQYLIYWTKSNPSRTLASRTLKGEPADAEERVGAEAVVDKGAGAEVAQEALLLQQK